MVEDVDEVEEFALLAELGEELWRDPCEM